MPDTPDTGNTWYDETVDDYETPCPACGEGTSYCQGHGLIGDPQGLRILAMHDEEDHSLCHPNSECQTDD